MVVVVVELVFLAAGVTVAAAVGPGVEVDGDARSLLWIPVLFGLVNVGLGPALHRLALPSTVTTLGLSSLVLNGLLLATTAGISDALDVGGLVATMLAAVVISVVTCLISLALHALAGDAV